VYAEDAAERNAAAFEIIADEESAALAHLLGGEVSTEFGGDGWFVVFNPLGFVVTAPVLIPVPKGQVNSRAVYAPDGSPVKCQIDHDGGGLWIIAEAVPAYGWRVYGLAAGSPGGDAPYPADVTHLENAHLTVRLAAPTGLLKSLVAKDLGGREFIDSEQAGNLLQIYHDKPDVFDSWDIGFDKYHDEPIEELREADDIELIESGPVRSVVRVTRHSQYETYWQDVIVYYDLPRVDFATHVFDWGTEAHRFLKAAFPLDLVNDGRLATSEMPYGTITRVLDGSVAYTELPGHKWTDIAENFGADRAAGPGLALLARDKYGYDVANDGPGEGLSDGRTNVLRLSLLKSATSPRYLLPEQGGPITDRGDFVVHYALYPHDGDARDANVYRYGHEYYAPLVVRFVGDAEPPARDAFAVTTPGNALLVWLKRPEVAPQNGEVLLRVVESVGQDVTAQVRLPEHRILAATRVNLLEEPEDDPVVLTDERTAEFALGAHEILTLRLQVETAPADDDDDDTESPDENPADDGGCGC
jgi:alpha-mannosidase